MVANPSVFVEMLSIRARFNSCCAHSGTPLPSALAYPFLFFSFPTFAVRTAPSVFPFQQGSFLTPRHAFPRAALQPGPAREILPQEMAQEETQNPAEEGPEQIRWPAPLSPLAGDEARKIELERALRAEAAMNSGPAFSSQDIIHEDAWLLVINKPSGIYAGHILASVESMLAARANSDGKPHLHLANRLDRDTSGVIVITKCKTTAGKLTHMFERRMVKKTYVALCIGPCPMWNDILVESGHGRSRWGAWRIYAREDVGRELPEKGVVKDMATRFCVISVNGQPISKCCTEQSCERVVARRDQTYCNVPAFGDEVLIRAYPLTGRTHQVRLHSQFLGLPLLGDVKYGGPLVWRGNTHETHLLHAESMSFKHPITAVDVCFSAPLPGWATTT